MILSILKRKRIFFEAGGDSLLLGLLNIMIEKQIGRKLRIETFFWNIRRLAGWFVQFRRSLLSDAGKEEL